MSDLYPDLEFVFSKLLYILSWFLPTFWANKQSKIVDFQAVMKTALPPTNELESDSRDEEEDDDDNVAWLLMKLHL